jgi:cation diffusion facilitator CzcD-associated flavoprotein CzcO
MDAPGTGSADGVARPEPGRASRRARRAAQSAGPRVVDVDVVVVGAGQAGLSAAHHLRKAGFVAVGAPDWDRADRTFVVLDDNPRPGGAWQHRWPALTMGAAHRVHDLPGMTLPLSEDDRRANEAVPEYFAQYEEAFDLHVQRPVRAERVSDEGAGRLLVEIGRASCRERV